jgi:hypothetical protein
VLSRWGQQFMAKAIPETFRIVGFSPHTQMQRFDLSQDQHNCMFASRAMLNITV